ncbi:hypothetical protein ARMSODRAFT_716361 [Armillaria solidipes]|uniref:Uncharacterized protein n=1 Tax=Armillaria solidipes TaxID=1076256 RepID=A0A2H3CCW4_9AGAR|nr:hypothetical protein ARMSODRAFT_716361 [Armillaria solidipes]
MLDMGFALTSSVKTTVLKVVKTVRNAGIRRFRSPGWSRWLGCVPRSACSAPQQRRLVYRRDNPERHVHQQRDPRKRASPPNLLFPLCSHCRLPFPSLCSTPVRAFTVSDAGHGCLLAIFGPHDGEAVVDKQIIRLLDDCSSFPPFFICHVYYGATALHLWLDEDSRSILNSQQSSIEVDVARSPSSSVEESASHLVSWLWRANGVKYYGRGWSG